jgi:hypothetical protein
MSLEPIRRREAIHEDSDEIKARKATLEKIESLSPEEFESAVKGANLSDVEKISMEHWRGLTSLVDVFSQRQAVRDLFFAAKHPSLKRIFDSLNIGVGTGYNKAESQQNSKLDEMEKLFRPGDFEQALEKMQKTLG